MGKNPYLEHGWGNTPEQKRKESEYNHQYYLRNKEKWKNNTPLSRQKNVTEDGKGVARRGEGLNASTTTNRPLARQKNITEDGAGVQRRGEGLNTGSVGTDTYDRSEVIDAIRKRKEQTTNVQNDQQRRELMTRAKRGTKRIGPTVNPYKAYGMADNEATKSYMKGTPTPNQIEAHMTVAKNKDRRAASSMARSNAAAESEISRMDASAARIRKRNASIERAAAAAASAQASQNKAAERYKEYEKSGLFKKQEADKRAEAEKNAQYQNRQNEIKKAISKKNGIQTEITNINNSIKRLQKEDPKGNAVKIDNLYKQLDQKKEAYKNMQAYINALNF